MSLCRSIAGNIGSSIPSGVFVCIRCSGIHRGMGTHISKVKSVDLDMWTPEQMSVSRPWLCHTGVVEGTGSDGLDHSVLPPFSRFKNGGTVGQTYIGKPTLSRDTYHLIST